MSTMFQFMLMNQKIPNNQKNEEWHKKHIFSLVDSIVKNTNTARRQEHIRLWEKTLCISNKKQEEGHLKKNAPVTKPYGYSLGIEWMDYPLIESKLEQLIGEHLAQEIKKKTYVLNRRAKIAKLDKMYGMIAEELMREVYQEIAPELGFTPETEQKDVELPENIEEFFQSDYKTESEETSDLILDMVLEAKKQKRVLKDLYMAFLVQDEVIADIVEENGHPAVKLRNTFNTIFDWHPTEEITKNPQFVAFNDMMPYNEILNNFDLTDDEEEIVKGYGSYQQENMIEGLEEETGFDSALNYGSWFSRNNGVLMIRVCEMRWISKKQIRVKISENKKTGKPIYKLIDDQYEPKKTDKIKKIWIDEKRHIIMVGPHLVLESGVIPERYTTLENIKKDRLLTIGLRRNGGLALDVVRSAAAKLEQLQDFASEILFEIRLAMRRNLGKVLVYDAAQAPKHFLKGTGATAYSNALNRVMHHAKKDQFLLINSKDKNSRYQFNQFTALDLSTRGQLMELFNMLALIEDLAAKFIGISASREGNVQKYETATGTERSVAQSTARSEIFTNPFEAFLQEIMECIIMKGKHVYEESELLEYIFGDVKSKFFSVFPSFFQDDIGVYIGDSVKDKKKKMIIDRAAEQAFTNAQTPELILTLTEVLNSEFSSEAEKILKRGVDALKKLTEENRAHEKELAEINSKAMAEDKQAERDLKREGYQKDLKISEMNNNTKIITSENANDTNRKISAAEIEKDYILKQNDNQGKEN